MREGAKPGRGRRTAALAGAAAMILASASALGQPVNKGPIDAANWVHGPAFQAPAGTIWNPAKVRMNNAEPTIGGTIGSIAAATSETTYCNIVNRDIGLVGASDFTWTEVQHSGIDWKQAWNAWAYPCAYQPSSAERPRGHVPGVRIAYTGIREIQKALDGGVMVLVVPTVDSVQEARDIVQMAYYPPIGKRRYRPGQWQKLYADVPGGYRETFNDNLVLWVMIETIEGSEAVYEIAKVPGIHGVFGATGDLGNFAGFINGWSDYNSLISQSHNAAHAAGKRACTAFGQLNRAGHTFTCAQR